MTPAKTRRVGDGVGTRLQWFMPKTECTAAHRTLLLPAEVSNRAPSKLGTYREP